MASNPMRATKFAVRSDSMPIATAKSSQFAKGTTSADLSRFADIDSLSEFEAKLLKLVAEMLSRLDAVANKQIHFQERLEFQLTDLRTTTREAICRSQGSAKESSTVTNGCHADTDVGPPNSTTPDTFYAKKNLGNVAAGSSKKVVFTQSPNDESFVSPLVNPTSTDVKPENAKQPPNPSSSFLTWSSSSWTAFGEEVPLAAPKFILPRVPDVCAPIDEAISNGTDENDERPTTQIKAAMTMHGEDDFEKRSSISSNDSIQDGFINRHSAHDWRDTYSPDGMFHKAARKMGDLFHGKKRSVSKVEGEHRLNSRGDSISTVSTQDFALCRALNRYVLNPESLFRTIFDISSFVVLLYDAISIPIILAWDPQEEEGRLGLKIGMLLSAVFWSSDCVLNFVTGYYVQGKLVLELNKIARRYFKGFFFMDFFLCFFDWFGLIMENVGTDSGTLGVLRVTKVHRLVRIIGVFRMSKVWARIERMNPYYFFEGFQIASEVSKIVCLILWINHLFCCMWYFLAAKVPSDTGVTWLDIIEESSVGSTLYMDQSMIYQYTTAYHWALTQMTPGSMQVFPHNSAERILNILCLIVGLVFGTSLTSRLSAKMVQLQMSRQEQVTKLMKLRRYLQEHSISANLASRIQRHVQQHVTTKKPLFESQVTVLSLLTPTLRQDLRYDLFQPHLLQCPFLRLCDKIDSTAMHSLCMIMAVRGIELGSEQLFHAGEQVSTTWIVVLGAFRYLADDTPFRIAPVDTELDSCSTLNTMQTMKTITTFNTVKTINWFGETQRTSCSSNSMTPEDRRKHEYIVEPGRWLCEFAMWLNWTTRGVAEPAEPCEVLAIDTSKILHALKRHVVIQNLYRCFCQAYSEVCDLDDDGNLDDALDDLGHGLLDSGQGEVITCMPIDSREIVARPILDELKDQAWFRSGHKMIKTYEHEVKCGKCAIFLDRHGNPERLALVASVHVSRTSDEHVLVQLGRVKHNEVVPSFNLPCSRLRNLEKPSEAAHRVLASEIGPLVPEPSIESATRTIDTRIAHNITTKYIRTTFFIKAEGEENFGHLPSMTDSASPYLSEEGTSLHDPTLSVVAIPLGEKQERFHRHSVTSNIFLGSTFLGHVGNTMSINPLALRRQQTQQTKASMMETKASMLAQRFTLRMSVVKSGVSLVKSVLPVTQMPAKVYFVKDPAGRARDGLQGHIYAWLHPDDLKDLEEQDATNANAKAYDLLSRMDQTVLAGVC